MDNKKSLLTYNEDENISLSSDWIKILTEAAIKTVGAVVNKRSARCDAGHPSRT